MNWCVHEDDPRHAVWKACESPIEQYLCCGLMVFLGCQSVSGLYAEDRLADLHDLCAGRPTAFLFSQHTIGRYRADFLLVMINPADRKARLIVMECDGRGYHSSDEQLASDAARDEQIRAAGYRTIIRLTGHEIHSQFEDVLRQVRSHLSAFGVRSAVPQDMRDYALLILQALPPPPGRRSTLYRLRDHLREIEDQGLDPDEYVAEVAARGGQVPWAYSRTTAADRLAEWIEMGAAA